MLQLSTSTHSGHASLQRGCTAGAAPRGPWGLPVGRFQPPWETQWVLSKAELPLQPLQTCSSNPNRYLQSSPTPAPLPLGRSPGSLLPTAKPHGGTNLVGHLPHGSG